MKIKPVIDALDRRGVESVFVHTGQHYDPKMSDVFFADLGLRKPDVHLGVGSGSLSEQVARTMLAFAPVVADHAPDVVVVVGDVNATMACSIVAAQAGVRLVHVEAGARSGDRSMPEEINRIVSDRLSDDLCAADEDAVANLRAEGYREESIHLVGNVMIDTLLANLERARSRPVLDTLGVEAGGFVLVTLHRAATVDDTSRLKEVVRALEQIAARRPVVFPVHPRTRERLSQLDLEFDPGLHLAEPFGYLDFLALQSSAEVVVTDSGGVQAETTALGIPCLTLRDSTEWAVTVKEGTNRLLGFRPDLLEEAVEEAASSPPSGSRPEGWDGHAAERIAKVIVGSQN